jgi:PAS domain S-box-containing protein
MLLDDSLNEEKSSADEVRKLKDLVAELRKSMQELREVQELANTIRTSSSKDDLIAALQRVLSHVLPKPEAALFLIIQGELQAVGEPSVGLLNLAHVCEEDGIIVWAFEEGRPISLPEISVQASGTDLLIPLIAMDRGIGILLVRSSIDRDSLTSQQLDLLAFAGSQTALALGNQALLEQQIESRERLQILIDHAGDLILLLDSEGRIRYANQHASLLSQDASHLCGRTFLDFLTGDEQKETFTRSLQGVEHSLEEWTLRVPEEIDVQISMSPMPIVAGDEAECLLILRDLRPLRELEAERRESAGLRALGLAAVRMNHEINSPLTAITGSLQLLSLSDSIDLDEREGRALNSAEIACAKIATVLQQFNSVKELKAVPYIGGSEMLDLSDEKSEDPS